MSQPLSTAGHVESRARTNKYYAKAVSSVPGYLEAAALRDKAREQKRAILFPMVVWPDEPTDINADLDAYLAAYTAAALEEQSRALTATALDNVAGACERRMRSAVDDPNILLTSLASDLVEVMAHVKDVVERLDGARTPTEAIDNNITHAWKELPALRREYDSIRHAQTLVLLDDPAMNHRSDHIDDPIASDVVIRNLDDILPTWRDPDTRYTLQGTPPDRRPWPEDAVEQLVWFVTSGAQVWLPTSSQLSELQRERRQRIDPPLDGEPGNLMSIVSDNPNSRSTTRLAQRIH